MEIILGIDLGTTNSEVAVIRNGKVEVLRENGEAILPSVVGLDNDGRLLVGNPARNQWVLAPERTIRSIKRKMGQDTTVRLGDRDYSPQEISAIILRTLKERAERELGHSVSKAVITVPAFFNEIQREATREAGELAGLEVLRIINEPTAAALTYDPHPDKMERLMVYDLGGGTFDVSIVQIEQNVVEVLASHGDTQLGGDDFDELLLDHVCKTFVTEHGVDPRQSLVAKSRILRAVEEAKKTLSFEPVAKIAEEFLLEKDGLPLHLDHEISRPEYEELIDPLVAKTLVCLDQSLSDAKLHVEQIDKVVLVGGASRTPLVQRRIEEQLGRPVHSEVDPDLCVAMGAAVQGGLIGGLDVGPVLVDITPHTLGIQSLGDWGGMPSPYAFSPIIHRNTPLPASRSEMFATVFDEQDTVEINVFQGESEDVRHNEKVGEFLLKGLADVSAGNEILVRFNLDLDGILKVTALERATGLQKQLTIDNSMSRFRMSNLEAARENLDEAFARAAEGREEAASGPVLVGGSPEIETPSELAHAAMKIQTLVAKAEKIAADASPEDRQEIEELIGKLRESIFSGNETETESVFARLEDIVFYLQDA